jgi:polysaccharide pyruvyl transferase WcaK-like protein
MNISIFASIWCQNLWDELILKNEISILKNKYKKTTNENINFNVFTYDISDLFYKKDYINYLEYFPIWIRKPNNIYKNFKNFTILIKTIISSDLIIIWWWWIFFDNELQKNKNPLNLWLFRIKLLKLFRKKIIFHWVWINIKSKQNLKKIKKIFSNANKIYVRDSYSKKLLENLWIESKEILDPVFYDNKKYKNISNKNYCIKSVRSKTFTYKDLKNIDLKWKKVWVAIRKWYFSRNQKPLSCLQDTSSDKFYSPLEEKEATSLEENIIIKQILNYIINKWWKIILLPHSFHKTDDIANDYNHLKNYKTWNIKITKSIQETYEIYKNKKIDICISQRLHSIILSQIYSINFIAISYSKKTYEIIKKITNQ